MKPYPCPVACPIKGVNPETPAQYFPVGALVKSPGGTYYYQICSDPVERKYLDFRGEFEQISIKKLNKELPAIAYPLSNGSLEQYRKAKEIVWQLLAIAPNANTGSHLRVPTLERYQAILGFAIFMTQKFPPSVVLAATGRILDHQDENPWIRTEKRYQPLPFKPTTYRVKTVWQDPDGQYKVGDRIKEFTFRWNPGVLHKLEDGQISPR